MKSEVTHYGFNYGPAYVERASVDDEKGWVWISVATKKVNQRVVVRVTKTGKTKVYKGGVELKAAAKENQ